MQSRLPLPVVAPTPEKQWTIAIRRLQSWLNFMRDTRAWCASRAWLGHMFGGRGSTKTPRPPSDYMCRVSKGSSSTRRCTFALLELASTPLGSVTFRLCWTSEWTNVFGVDWRPFQVGGSVLHSLFDLICRYRGTATFVREVWTTRDYCYGQWDLFRQWGIWGVPSL